MRKIGLCFLLPAAVLKAPAPAPAQPAVAAPIHQSFTRASMQLLGICSPRFVYNIIVRLFAVPGVERFRVDIKSGRMLLDFKPGVAATREEVKNIMVSAGFAPGPFELLKVPLSEAPKAGSPYWHTFPVLRSKNALGRWFELNFPYFFSAARPSHFAPPVGVRHVRHRDPAALSVRLPQ